MTAKNQNEINVKREWDVYVLQKKAENFRFWDITDRYEIKND